MRISFFFKAIISFLVLTLSFHPLFALLSEGEIEKKHNTYSSIPSVNTYAFSTP